MSTGRVTIDSIAAGGDGVGRSGGMVVFVPRSAPGDVVTATLVGKKRFARGTIVGLDRRSANRVQPPCHHYVDDRCGGCQLQHMTYAAQLEAKSTIIRDGLTRIGKRSVEAPIVDASPIEWRYRTRLTLAIRNLPRGWVFGLHPFDDPAGVFQLTDCLITDERVVAIWREIFSARALLPAETERGSVRISSDGSPTVVIEGGTTWNESERFFQALPGVTALWWKPAGLPRSLVANREGADESASFDQVNAAVAATLHASVIDLVRRHSPVTVVDAYAGTGATAVPLALGGITVTAIELDRHAAAACAARLPVGSQSLTGRVEDLLPRALPADVVILNPPRTGLDDSIPAALELVTPRPKAIIYVSCNPATLGRDVARMPSFRIASLRGFDMFPQTAHVETICELVPEAA